MIRFIAAIDNNRGIADDEGIPWNLPTDKAYYRAKVRGHTYLIGHGTYDHHTKPLPDTPTYVATEETSTLRPGFHKITDARKFLKDATDDVWVGGGAALFTSTIDLADELYITQIDADFNCTKYFPVFQDDFHMVEVSEPYMENGISYQFEIWKRNS